MSSFGSAVSSAGRASLAGGLCFILCACTTRAADPRQAASSIDSLLSQEYPAGEPGAAVLVSRGGTAILKRGYGLANTERKVPVTPETVFRLASVTKMFTGTAILMLAERNQLALDDPVAKILPASPASGPITVRHLLSHTAGLADYLDRPDSMAWARNEHTVQDLVDAFKNKRASFEPGQKTAYSNSNYVLLGAIIEKVSGLSFGQFVKTNLFEPLGMTSTSCEGRFDDIPGLATAYEPARTPDDQPDWSRLLVARPYTMSALYTAGGCVSSVEDLARFHEGVFRGRVIGRRALSENFEPARLNSGSAGTMSLGGWQLDTIQGRRAAMRGGALPGVCTWFLMMPDEDVVVILLSNRTPGKPRCGMLAVQIAGIAAGE
jgi:CubicO group peptidase (beta-lactamase class C family)